MFGAVQRVLDEYKSKGYKLIAIHGKTLSNYPVSMFDLVYVLIKDDQEVRIHRNDEKKEVWVEFPTQEGGLL